jgi:hypothetical protein
LKPASAKTYQQSNLSTMPNTTTLFGLTPQEHSAAVLTSLGEAGPGKDLYAVYSAILNRKLSGGYGKDVTRIVTAPQQFVVNAGLNQAQVADPNFGRKRYGKRYDEAYNALNDPNKLAPVFNQLKGATSFRGQSLLRNKQKNDVMVDPKGNFYFDYKPTVHQKGSKLLSSTGVNEIPQIATATAQQSASPNIHNFYVIEDNQDTEDYLPSPIKFLNNYSKNLFDVPSVLQAAFNSGGNINLS